MLRESTSPLGIVEIAGRLDVHPNTVRFHLDALADSGQVECIRAAPVGPGRPPLMFRARRGMDPAGPRNYRLLAEILVNSLATDPDPAGRAAAAGRVWGAHLAAPPPPGRMTGDQAVDQVMRLLDDVGFKPERRSSADGEQIGLRHCPFLELAQTQSGIICPLHLGLMQGAMTALGTPVTVQRLDPFAEPDLCLAHLTTSEGAS